MFRPGSQLFWGPLSGCCAPFPSAASGSGSQMLGALSPGAVRLFPPRPQRAPPVGSQEVFRQEPRPVCRVGGGGFSGAEFAPCPSPCLLPPAGMGRLLSGGESFSVPLFCEPPAVCSRRSIFLSLSHSLKKISLRLLLFTFKHPFPTHILHQDLLTDSPLNREELNPQSRSKSPFLIPPSILHNGRILLVLRGINKSVSVIMIIILMISLK